jgi:phosphate transport system substrate-binding protein
MLTFEQPGPVNRTRLMHWSASKMVTRSLALACVLALGLTAGARAAPGVEVIGAGASFPAPAIEAWAEQFSRETGVRVLYRSVGSGEGIRRVTARSADFGMTEVPLTQAELVQDDLLQFPVIVGAVVPVVNIPGIADGELKLTGEVLADIYLGKIKRWNAPALKELNPRQSLPDLPIRVVYRADGSGTSFVFTYYLSRVSSEWQQRLGIGSRLAWPVGVGAKGSEGVAQAVHDAAGSIGYVLYAYAVQHNLVTVQLRNKAGKFARVSETGVRAAVASAHWSHPGYYEVLVNQDGDDSWPIVGVSFALIHQRQEDHADAVATLSFLSWIYSHGADVAHKLHYLTLEDAGLIERIESSWSKIRDEEGGIVWKDRQ